MSLGLVRRAGFDACKQLERLAENRRLDLRFLVALLRLLDEVGDAPLEAVEVGEHQLGLDRLGVGDRIDAALDVGHVAALETAQDVDDGVHLADVGEELVAEAFALGRAADEAGDVDELDLRLDRLRALGDARNLLEALVRDRDAADVRLDRAEGIVGGLRRRRLGQRIEKRGFTDIRQSDDAATKAHEFSSQFVIASEAKQSSLDRHVATLLAMTEVGRACREDRREFLNSGLKGHCPRLPS